MPWEIVGNCVHKQGSPEPIPGGCHATVEEARRHMAALYANEEAMHQAEYVFEQFVATRPGEPYRWLPFGTIAKGGKRREITPEFAAKLKLPHYKPPIKLGSHDPVTPAGGHIVGFEVRADGIYVIPEYAPAGERALTEGQFRYHSPEILFEGYMEQPDGTRLPAPLILGDAMLHDPHLGEQAALYTVALSEELPIMTTDTVSVPSGLWDRLMARLFPAEPAPAPGDPPPAAPAPPETEAFAAQLAAAQAQAEQYRAELETLKAEAGKQARIEQFSAALKETKADTQLAEMLAGLPADAAEAVLTQFRALSAQIDEAALVTTPGRRGSAGGAGGAEQFSAAIDAYMAEHKTNYPTAAAAVASAQPELYAAWAAEQKKSKE